MRSAFISLLLWAAIIWAITQAVLDIDNEGTCSTNDDDGTPYNNDDNNAAPSSNDDNNHPDNNDDNTPLAAVSGQGRSGAAEDAYDPCESGSFRDQTSMFWTTSLPFLAAMFAVSLCESCCSDTRRYLSNMNDVTGAEGFLQRIIEKAPDLVMKCECYHYETRTRVITTRDSNGNTSTRYETYTVRVTTYRETSYFSYEAWRDDSGPYHGLSLYSIVKLKLFKLLVWADDASKRTFWAAFAAFNARNRWRDTHYNSHWFMNVPGFKKNILSITDEGVKPWWLSLHCFCLWSLIGCSWCFRRLLTTSSVDAEFTFKKVIRA